MCSSDLRKNLDTLSLAEITDCLMYGSQAMAISDKIVNRLASANLIQTEITLFSSSGSNSFQNFHIVNVHCAATASDGPETQTRSWGRGPSGQWGAEVFDKNTFASECKKSAEEALELLRAENCPNGAMDIILMPDQMMLQIHESIGHPLELDRILGDERNYAGWSFVRPDDFGKLRYGSPIMNVTFDQIGRAHV